MGYQTIQRVRQWVEPGLGNNDPGKVLDAINRIRREWYSWYAKTQLFLDAIECFELQCFYTDCQKCTDTYVGVTLPRDFAAVEAMWYERRPVKLHNRWRQWHSGISPECVCGLQKFEEGDDYSTERDMAPGMCTKLRIVALDPADEGKKFVLRGIDAVMGEREVEFALSRRPQLTEFPFKAITRRGGVSKEVTVGRVLLAEESGRVLSMYDPGETVPAYKRIRITGVPAGCQFVNIRAARQYVELFDEFDVVETDNQPAWEAMARYLRINRKTDRSRDDLQSEASYLGQAREMLLGDKSRVEGKTAAGNVRIPVPQFNRLNRSRRCW